MIIQKMTLLTFISNQIEYQLDLPQHGAFQLFRTKRRNANSFITFPIFCLRYILAINILKIPT